MLKKLIGIILPVLFTLLFIGCDKSNNSGNDIVYQAVNKEYVLIRNVQQLLESDDEISNYVDSILTGLIETEFISTGNKHFDLNGDKTLDIGFEIINLNEFNANNLPESLDSLAARVIPSNVEILDNSTYGYPDALDLNDEISENGNWVDNTCVLGTFMNAGQFQGKGEKYLGIRFSENSNYKFGWIKVYCSEHNDTLKIIDYAYNDIENSVINAGQVE